MTLLHWVHDVWAGVSHGIEIGVVAGYLEGRRRYRMFRNLRRWQG